MLSDLDATVQVGLHFYSLVIKDLVYEAKTFFLKAKARTWKFFKAEAKTFFLKVKAK